MARIKAKLPQTHNGRDYTWTLYDKEDTLVDVLELEDNQTGLRMFERFFDGKLRPQSLDAYAMIRHSRSPMDTIEIAEEIQEQGRNSDKRLNMIFGYGHASAADMSVYGVEFDNVPMHFPLAIFNYGELNSGQEKSTRYQKEFENASLHPLQNYLPIDLPQRFFADLEKDYQALGELAREKFKESKELITTEFNKFYKPRTKKQQGARNSRVLDTARSHLLLGQGTGFGFKTSARDWAQLIGALKATDIPIYNNAGEQLNLFLAPPEHIEKSLGIAAEAPSLIRYTNADERTKNNLGALATYLAENTQFDQEVRPEHASFAGEHPVAVQLLDDKSPGLKMAAQYVLSNYPDRSVRDVYNWLDAQDDATKKEISNILYQDHTHHNMLSQLGRTTGLGVEMQGSLAEARDWNRQRAWGRMLRGVPVLNAPTIDSAVANGILNKGYVLTNYLEHEDLADVKKHVKKSLEEQYDATFRFIDKFSKRFGDELVNYSTMLNLLPLGHKSEIIMHGDPRQADYMTKLRVRPGGHTNYRQQAWDANMQIADSDPFLEGLRLDESQKPIPSDRTQFFDRS